MEQNNKNKLHSISPTNPEVNILSSSQTDPEKIFAYLDNSLNEKLEIFVRNELKKTPEK